MTDLIERYVAAIARELPEKQRADIAAELRDELMNRVEAQEAAQGRPLERNELEALLIEFGNPLIVAGRYRTHQHLVGPSLFPFWWAALRIALLVIAAIHIAIAAVALLGGEVLPDVFPSLVETLIFAFGAVTLVFAAVERFGKPDVLTRWKPATLPPARGRTRRRFDILVEIAMGVVAILWWLGLIHFRSVLPVFWLDMELAPVWRVWFWPILIYLAFELAMNLHALLQPGRVVFNRSLMIVRCLAGAAILGGVLPAGHFVQVSGDHLPEHALEVIQANVDRGFQIGISVAIAVFLALAAVDAWRLWQGYQARRGAPAL